MIQPFDSPLLDEERYAPNGCMTPRDDAGLFDESGEMKGD